MTTDITVLVVDDDEYLVGNFVQRVSDECIVRIARSGRQALERLDDAVDIVLVNGEVQGLSGEKLIERIRERELDCRIALVTGIEPSAFLRRTIDTWLYKPISAADLHETVTFLKEIATLDEQYQEFIGLVTKLADLETRRASQEDEVIEQLRRLEALAVSVETEIERRVSDLEFEDVLHAVVAR